MNQAAIEINSISKYYPNNKVLNNISFKVKKNRIHGFLGPNGAGKSTTMKVITGLLHPNSGNIKILENQKIGYLPEIPPLYLGQLVGEYLRFVQDIYINKKTSSKSKKEFYEKALKRCGLCEVENRLIKNLSKGFKQRVGMASTLVSDPDILIFDEPTVGLDPKAIIEIRELILELRHDHTILLSTHQLHEASLLCDDLTIINKGNIIKSGTVQEIRTEFFTNKVYVVETDSCSDELVSYLNSKLHIKNLRVDKTEIGSRLTIETSSEESEREIRPLIGRAVLEHDLMLYSLAEKVPDLEDVFKKATGELQ